MSTFITTITQALGRVSLEAAAAFVRRVLASCGATSQQAYDALCALVATVISTLAPKSITTLTTTSTTTSTTTTTVNQSTCIVRDTPTPRSLVYDATAYEILAYLTEIDDVKNSGVASIVTPMYAAYIPQSLVETAYECIEAAETPGSTLLLAFKNVGSVSSMIKLKSKRKATTVAARIETDDESIATASTASDSESDSDTESDDDNVVAQVTEEPTTKHGATTCRGDAHEDTNDDDEEESDQETGQAMEEEEERQQHPSQDEDQHEGENKDLGDNRMDPTTEEMVSVWPTLPLDSGEENTVGFDWTIQVYQRPLGTTPVFGSVLLQRRLLGV